MSIYSTEFAVYERLASAKMNSFKEAINSHTHDGSNGVAIPFSYIVGLIDPSQIPNASITGAKIALNTISKDHLIAGQITTTQLNLTSIHLDTNGYAVYAP